MTEIVDGSRLIRVKPMSGIHREYSEKCVSGIGYQGNNLLCSDWDAAHMENLDYNGLYEALYEMKYQEKFNPGGDSDGIPQKEFESLIMEYLPVTAEQEPQLQVYRPEPLPQRDDPATVPKPQKAKKKPKKMPEYQNPQQQSQPQYQEHGKTPQKKGKNDNVEITMIDL